MKNYIQQKICAIFNILKSHLKKLHISLFIGGQFKRLENRLRVGEQIRGVLVRFFDRNRDEETHYKNILNKPRMLINQEEFEKANIFFKKLLDDIDYNEVESSIKNELDKLDIDKHYDFLRHISTLFLNVYLNNYGYGEKKKSKSTYVRSVISKIITENNY
jgi:hypothetical protein